MKQFNEHWDGIVRGNRANLTEGMSLSQMGYAQTNDWVQGGTHLIGKIKASVNQLKAVLGNPIHQGKSGDGKTTMEWVFVKKNVWLSPTKSGDIVFSVYDYKNPPPQDGSVQHSWSVGGNDQHKAAIRKVLKLAGLTATMLEEAQPRTDDALELTEAAAAPKHSVKVGDIFYSSWGYDQTNTEFYIVTKVTGASVVVIELDSVEKSEPVHMTGTVTPHLLKKPKDGAVPKRTVVKMGYDGKPMIKTPMGYNAYLWDGKPKQVSHYA